MRRQVLALLAVPLMVGASTLRQASPTALVVATLAVPQGLDTAAVGAFTRQGMQACALGLTVAQVPFGKVEAFVVGTPGPSSRPSLLARPGVPLRRASGPP